MKISGALTVLKNLRRATTLIGSGAEIGLIRGGLMIQALSQKEVPVELSNLKNSAFTRKVGGSGLSADVVVGYTASYAVYVHENLDAAHGAEYNQKHRDEIRNGETHSRGANQKAKFLEDPLKENRHEVINHVKKAINEEMHKK
jgi:hypothetical protein